jgi:uncharacterized membrane protein
MSRRRRWSEVYEALWFEPALAIVGALLLGWILSNVAVAPGSLLDQIAFKGSVSDGRQLLAVVTGTMITVTSLVFALTVVSLQIAGTQFSPRLLRSFLRDRGTQMVLSTFVGTVSYSLAGLHTVGSNGGGAAVPRLAVSGSLVLALISVGMLVYYVAHITNAIRIDTIMRSMDLRARHVLRRDHPPIDEASGDADAQDDSANPDSAITVPAPREGYFQGVDGHALVSLARREGLTVRLLQLVGYHVVEGQALATVWVTDGSAPRPAVCRAVAAAIYVAQERKVELDVGFGVRQLVDVTNRAMSTGQNDPYTAVQAIHHLTNFLVDAAGRSFAVRRLADADGRTRVIVPVMAFPTHLKVVCGHIRQGGLERHPRVTLELLRLLGSVAEAAVGDARREAVQRELDLVVSDARRMIPAAGDLDEIECAATVVRAALQHRSHPPVGARQAQRVDNQTALSRSSRRISGEP